VLTWKGAGTAALCCRKLARSGCLECVRLIAEMGLTATRRKRTVDFELGADQFKKKTWLESKRFPLDRQVVWRLHGTPKTRFLLAGERRLKGRAEDHPRVPRS
jgi:hypothetical protein